MTDTGQGDQLITMQMVEIGHVAHPDFQKIVEIPRHQMTIKNKGQVAAIFFEFGKTFRGRSIKDHADNYQRSPVDLFRGDLGADVFDIAFLKQLLRPTVAGCGTDIDLFGNLGIAMRPSCCNRRKIL